LIELISRVLGVQPEIEVDKARIRGNQTEVMQLLSDNSKAAAVLGWKPAHSMEEGIRRTIEWVEQHKGLFKADIYNK
jgi:nucleoside-diphosphate-sugar epimerase